ncbi:hypothetical protein L3X38_031956 [Prunus dulcis]|uniref:DUF4218 domain-containing protein n=1 Tax=Prunus dulcis TaxID=3755 RepID=A0AAD4YVK6_PRUDU|nr:hypothetical protein L3X38_031956 [Prunus dulcis]
MIFPTAFFTSIIHVMVHLPEKALLAGPVNYHWMYPIERLLEELKQTVRYRMSNLIRSHKAVTTAQSSPPPAQPSAATAPALMDHLLVGPGLSLASTSSMEQPRVGNGSGFGYVGGNNLVVDLNPSPYAIRAPDPRFEVGAMYETMRPRKRSLQCQRFNLCLLVAKWWGEVQLPWATAMRIR